MFFNTYREMFKRGIALFVFGFLCLQLAAQEQEKAPFPEFILQKVATGKVRVGWVNPYGNELVQVSVQRSYDSLKGFRTMFSPQSPELPENGFIDNYIEGTKVFYRIFYMLSSNAYFFTKTKKVAPGFIEPSVATITTDSVTVKIKDVFFAKFPFEAFQKFKDSIYSQTKDSLMAVGNSIVLLKPFVSKPGEWRASVYMYTDRGGVLNLKLPLAKEKRYSLQVFDTDGTTELFKLKRITETSLTIDKANFLHAGWFTFELYEDDKIKEKNKFYIQKEF